MIRVENLVKSFGGLRAVDGASLEIAQGAITGLIGPNGAGKTTLFNVIAGAYAPDEGRVLLDGEDITGLAPHHLFDRGLLRTFQIAHEFATLTVRENLMAVPPAQDGETLWNAWFKPSAVRAREAAVREKADEVIDFLQLGHVADELAGNLSGGQKKLLELGRTLLNSIGEAIARLNRERGYTFCMIEHDMDFIGRLCDPVIVMAEGRVLTEGSVAQVKADERVIEAYLGRGLKNRPARRPTAAPEAGA